MTGSSEYRKKGVARAMIRRLFVLSLPVLILAVGFLTARYMLETRREVVPAEDVAVEAGQPGDVATVSTLPFEPETAAPELVLYGQLLPVRRVEVSARLGGGVAAVTVAEGDPVAEGDVLVRIDAREAERQRERAENRLREQTVRERQLQREQAAAEATLEIEDELVAIAQRAVTRTRDLQQRNLASASDVDAAEQNLQQQRLSRRQQQLQVEGHADRLEQLDVERRDLTLEIEELSERIEDAEVRAPFAGQVVALDVEAGARVAADSPLLTLVDGSAWRVRAQLPLHHAPLLAPGMQAVLESDQQTVDEQRLTLEGWEPVSRGGSLRLQLALESPPVSMVADRHYRLRLLLPAASEVMRLPVSALYENRFVYRVDEDSRLERIEVSVVGYAGNGENTQALIRSDELQAGDSLLITRLANAVTGLPVLVRED